MAAHEKALPDQVREACAWVAEQAASVSINEGALHTYAGTLTDENGASQGGIPDPLTETIGTSRELRAAFVICLDAINFGSGWWPTVRKRPGHSGYFTMAAGLADRFRASGSWPAEQLAEISAAEVASTLAQDPAHPLMADFAASLRDVGQHVRDDHGGRFAAVVEAADDSAVGIAELLSRWVAFGDVSTYEGRPVPFFKRGQIAAADLRRAGVADLRDEERLTAFADNLVPHVLRVDGILRLEPGLERAIDSAELLVHDSPEEVELRACGVHAVELLADAVERRLSPAAIDSVLWNRGGQARYKAIPRPRCQNTAY